MIGHLRLRVKFCTRILLIGSGPGDLFLGQNSYLIKLSVSFFLVDRQSKKKTGDRNVFIDSRLKSEVSERFSRDKET